VFVALGIQHEICTFYIFICGLPGFKIFVYISQKGKISEKKNTDHKMSGMFLILSRIERDTIKNVYWLFLSVLM